jgi:hypothetical protein
LEFEPLYNLYKSAFNNELEALDIILKSELTPQITEQDSLRDSLYRGFSDTVKGFRNHFDEAYRTSANKLWNIFLHYGNVAQKTLDAETAAINDLIREFKQPDLAKAVEFLKLNEWLNKLDAENARFQQLMMERYAESTSKTTYRMKTARLETDKYYRAIVAHLENKVLLDVNHNNAKLKECVTELNAIIGRYKSILAQEFGRKNNKGGAEL